MLFDDDTKSANENPSLRIPLPPGEYEVNIVASAFKTFKTDEVVVDMKFTRDGDERRYSHWFAINAANDDRRRIARSELKAVWDACGFTGKATDDRVSQFAGNRIKVKVNHTPSKEKNEDGSLKEGFTNIQGAWPAETKAPAGKYHTPDDDPDDKIDTTPSPAPVTTAEATGEAPKKATRWKKSA